MGLIKSMGIDKYIAEREKASSLTVDVVDGVDRQFLELERKQWYNGDNHSLEMFYKTHQLYQVYPGYLFWRVVNNDQPRVHYPLASAISNAFGSLLFSNTPKFSVETGSKARNKKYEQRLKEIFQVNDILSLLQQSAQQQSYSGGVALKLNIDYSLADTPMM
jgi:hypothetical protein